MNSKLYKRDGHIHTPFCPHGTKDSLEMYVEKALQEGREEITFAEHFPMPDGVTTPEFKADCTITEEQVEDYKLAVDSLKIKYKNKIKINYGFEVDYIEDMEEVVTDTLDKYGKGMEDGILSIHFVKYEGEYYGIDYLPDFERLVAKVEDLRKIYDIYFNTLLKSIKADLGVYKPTRIGHPSLIRIFNQKYPIDYFNEELFNEIIVELKKRNYSIDYNMAGLRKPYCGETYPSGEWLELIKEADIDMVMGSDAHSAEQIKILV